MASGFLESRIGRPWNYDRGEGNLEYYQGTGAIAEGSVTANRVQVDV